MNVSDLNHTSLDYSSAVSVKLLHQSSRLLVGGLVIEQSYSNQLWTVMTVSTQSRQNDRRMWLESTLGLNWVIVFEDFDLNLNDEDLLLKDFIIGA